MREPWAAEVAAAGPTPGPYKDSTGSYTINADGTATYNKPAKSAATIKIPNTITVEGFEVKVTAIANKAFNKDKKLTTVTIGKYVETIGSSAFASCAKLKTVKGGAGVVTIKDSAFKGSKVLTAITLNKNVTTIGKNAFNGCKKLKTITIKTAKLESIGGSAFKGIVSNATFKCPKKQLTTYKKMISKAGAPKKAQYKK